MAAAVEDHLCLYLLLLFGKYQFLTAPIVGKYCCIYKNLLDYSTFFISQS